MKIENENIATPLSPTAQYRSRQGCCGISEKTVLENTRSLSGRHARCGFVHGVFFVYQ